MRMPELNNLVPVPGLKTREGQINLFDWTKG